MAISIVQVGTVVNGGGGDVAFSLPSAITLGNHVLLGVAWDGNDNNADVTATDVLTNSYSGLANFLSNTSLAPGHSLVALSWLIAHITNAGSLSGTIAMGGARGGGVALEIAGLDPSGPLDQQIAVGTASLTSLTTGAVTTTVADEILLAVGATLGAGASTLAPGSGYTLEVQGAIDPGGQMAVEAQIVSSTGSYTAAMSNFATGGWASLLLVTLKAVAAPSGPTIYSQPADVTVTEPASATFSVIGVTSGGSLSYQWNNDAGPVYGEISDTITVTPTSHAADNGDHYWCTVTDDNGSTDTRHALLTVNSSGGGSGTRCRIWMML